MGTKPIDGFKRTDSWTGLPTCVVIAGHDTVETFPANPLVDEDSNAVSDASLEPMIGAMKASQGFLGSIEGTKLGGRIYAVNGRRRTRALRILNERRGAEGLEPYAITVRLITVDPKSRNLGLFAAVCTLNEHTREKTPYERCRQALQMQKYGATVQDCADVFGVNPRTVEGWLNIAELSPKAQKAVASGQIPAVSSGELKDLPESVQDEVVEEAIVSGGGKAKAKGVARVVAKKRGAGSKSQKKAPPRGKKEIRKLCEKAAQAYAKSSIGDNTLADEAFTAGVQWAIGDIGDQTLGLGE